ncbi:transposase [Oxalobacter vibrioformis]|uniref:Transposase n=1 Tax=Oxalobacter vibrioformis TaxID=933080 RepID=A0A9E9P2W6_9BURK|nr:transposase [Oxalobacter vibrioformis]
MGKTRRGKGTKLMVIADAHGFPLAVHTDSAWPHEVTLVEKTLDEVLTRGRVERLVGDRAYDSDPLDQRLAFRRVEMIAPHRKNRKRPATQDGRGMFPDMCGVFVHRLQRVYRVVLAAGDRFA